MEENILNENQIVETKIEETTKIKQRQHAIWVNDEVKELFENRKKETGLKTNALIKLFLK